jgi:2-polyprenyl-3-methyl-5-hydroxy-6-metoxy-1,4-benzoquinol methylase
MYYERHMQPYFESPKVILIAGPRCSGKTYIGNKIATDFMFSCISQDHVRLEIEKKHKFTSKEMSHPKTKKYYKKVFMQRLRDIRYSDIVVEGARLAHDFVFDAFIEALNIEYGQYVICKPFFLMPDLEIRYERYAERIKKHIKELKIAINRNANDFQSIEKLESIIISPFDAFPIVPSKFKFVDNQEEIVNWICENICEVHKDFPVQHSELLRIIAKSNSPFSPFYQTVDIGNERIIEGQTRSYLTWDNIKKLGIEWKGKKVCELGCNNGYFLFKAEALGAICDGYDREEDSIKMANVLKNYNKSKINFYIQDISNGIENQYDIVMALNMLHYIDNIDVFLKNISSNTSQLIFEIGKNQLESVVSRMIENGFKLKKNLESHRKKSVIGDRVVLHYVKRQ